MSAASPSTSSRSSRIWKARPRSAGVGDQRRARRRRGRAEDRAGLAGEGDQRPGLEALQLEHPVEVERPASAERSIIWPPHHAVGAGGRGEPATRTQRTSASGWVAGSASTSNARRLAGRRRQGSRSPRRTAVAAGPAAAVRSHRPSPAGRRGPGNSRGSARPPRRPAAPARAGTANSAAPASTRNGRSRLPPPRMA